MDDDTLNQMLQDDLIPLGLMPAVTTNGGRYGEVTEPGWVMFYYAGLGSAAIYWGKPGDRQNVGQQRGFDDATERLSHLGEIYAALKPLGYGGAIEIWLNDTPNLILTDIPTR